MQHFRVSHVDSDVRDAVCSVGSLEKHKISRLYFVFGHVSADIVQSLSRTSSYAPSRMVVDPRDKSGAVKGGFGRAATPDVWIAEEFFRFRFDFCECVGFSEGILMTAMVCSDENSSG